MILDEIVARKRERLAQVKKELPLGHLRRRIERQPAPRDFGAALRKAGVSLIAEVKKASPSKGPFKADLDVVNLARTYAQNGAAAISVLTEEDHFQGGLGQLEEIRSAMDGGEGVPLLRKDFIFDPYQIYEARAFGADAILLIAALLDDEELRAFLYLSRLQGMQCLVEVHDEDELRRALDAGAEIIGVNNRDLRTFAVDLGTTKRLRPLVPQDRLLVSESGIRSRADIEPLAEWGVDAVLVGEALVTADDVAAKVRELV